MILFLDYDGVLHPDAAYMGTNGPALRGDGSLFMWAELLADALAEHPGVQIVLSTSWVRRLPFDQVRDFLPPSLRERVIGSTWHHIQHEPEFSRDLPFSYWQDAIRYQQIRRWVSVYRVGQWCAIDDDGGGWPDADRDRLVLTDSARGLSDPTALARLAELLK